ncbi:uncharacterized protein si:dkey-229e3.2 isoform X2 [Conger conger]|uniref:uncharacterized protein si:dkey-229e3.2 isoform X2 n=1 Tax=Conger conger TaxID=82655 RepID=UPI002A5B0793|nr:uncharacterized protein si:dkey-229e3.2 isoform X2 [Conger conger]
MNEPAILDDSFGGNTKTVYDSCDFEDSLAQAVSAPNNAKFDNSFGEWTHFAEEDRWNQHHQCSTPGQSAPLNQSHLETSEQSESAKEKIIESPCPWQIFHNSFPMVNTSEDATTGEVEPLLQLFQKSSEPPPLGSVALCDAASLWSRLLREPSGLRTPESRGCPNITRGLHSALKITDSVSSHQSAPPAETSPAEASGVPARPPAGSLIQTKLLANPHHRDAPNFFYQVSSHWVFKHHPRLQDDNHKKGFFF